MAMYIYILYHVLKLLVKIEIGSMILAYYIKQQTRLRSCMMVNAMRFHVY